MHYSISNRSRGRRSNFNDVLRRLSWNSQLLLRNARRRLKSKNDVKSLIAVILWIVFFIFSVYKILDTLIRWYYLPKYASKGEANFRRQRFPSIDDRVRLYMSNWYLPPCTNDGKLLYERKMNITAPGNNTSSDYLSYFKTSSLPTSLGLEKNHYYYAVSELSSQNITSNRRVLFISDTVILRRIFFLEESELDECFQQKTLSIRFYCSNSKESILLDSKAAIGWNDDVPILCQFSDETDSFSYDLNGILQSNPRIPIIKKIRHSLSRVEIDRLTQSVKITDEVTNLGDFGICQSGTRLPPSGLKDLQPIIWLLNVNRHYKATRMVRRWDQSFETKKDQAVFRGLLTGLEYNAQASDDENCQNLIRCDVVYRYASSKFVDAKLTSTFNKLPELHHGVNMTGSSMKQREMLSYKGIIILEGNGTI